MNYLSSGLLKGIDSSTARAIVDRFGVNSLDVLERQPEKLLEIRGITKERLEEIKAGYAESTALRDLMILRGLTIGSWRSVEKSSRMKNNEQKLEQLDRLAAMSDDEVMVALMKQVSADTEKLTRRNMKDCVSEHIQTLCLDDCDKAVNNILQVSVLLRGKLRNLFIQRRL